MVVILNLKGLELLAFALVYGFTQDGQSWFSGSIKYVEKWLNCSRPTAISTLEKLTASKLLIKQDAQKQGIESNRYRANLAHIEVVKKSYYSSKETSPPVVKKFNQSSKEILPDIYNNTIEDKIESAPAQFHVQLHSLETIPSEIGEVPRPAARPTSKVSDLQRNLNAHGEAAEHFLRLLQSNGHSLNGAEKYAADYFRHKQQKGEWYALLIPDNTQAAFRWLGEHSAGVQQWAKRQPQFERNNSQPAAPTTAVATGMRLSNPENAPR